MESWLCLEWPLIKLCLPMMETPFITPTIAPSNDSSRVRTSSVSLCCTSRRRSIETPRSRISRCQEQPCPAKITLLRPDIRQPRGAASSHTLSLPILITSKRLQLPLPLSPLLIRTEQSTLDLPPLPHRQRFRSNTTTL